jgi:hypothetical protein
MLPEALQNDYWKSAGQTRLPIKRQPSRQNELCPATSSYTERGPVIFLSCKADVGVKLKDEARATLHGGLELM